jgi:hypothetical protein
MARYQVSLNVLPVQSCPPLNEHDGIGARRTLKAPCARDAAGALAAPYLDAGLVVDWKVRRTGLLRLGRRWHGQFAPGGDDGLAGVREPRRPRPSNGSAAATA